MKTSDLIRQATQFPGKTAYDAFVNDNSLDIEEEQALQDRGLLPSADTREAFNKFNPVELLSQLLSVLSDQGLDEAVNAVKKVTPIVNHAWTHRTKGSAKGVIAMVRKRVAELEPGPSLPVKDKLRDFFRDNPYPDDSKVHKLAEELQMSPHDLETEIYSLLSDLLKENPA